MRQVLRTVVLFCIVFSVAIAQSNPTASSLLGQGFASFNQGNYQAALDEFSKALELSQAEKNRPVEANCLLALGFVYDRGLNQKDVGVGYYVRSLEVFKELKDRKNEEILLSYIGVVYKDLGQPDKALEYYQQALPVERELGDETAEAATLHNIATVYSNIGQPDKALEYYQKALGLRKKLNDQKAVVRTLSNIGIVYGNIGQPREAIKYLEQALTIARELKYRDVEAAALNNIGKVYFETGQPEQALKNYLQALEIFKELKQRDMEGATLNNIGVLYGGLGQHDEALKNYQQALSISRDLKDRDLEDTALHNIAHTYQQTGQPDEAIKYYQQSLLISREIQDLPGEAVTLSNLGSLYNELGQPDEAMKNLEQALKIHRQVKDRSGEASALNNIGSVFSDLDQPDEAFKFYQQALDIRREVQDRSGEAATLNNIGFEYKVIGQPQEALKYFQQALAIHREVKDRSGEATALNNIGDTYQTLGRLDEALESYQQSVRINREIKSRVQEASALNNMGNLFAQRQQPEEAMKYLQQSLQLNREVKNRPKEATSLNNIGAVQLDLGKLDEAINFYQQALTIHREVRNQVGQVNTLFNLGAVYRKKQQLDVALDYFGQATALLESRLTTFKTDETKSGLQNQNQDVYKLAIQTALEANKPELAFSFSEHSRARLFLDQLGNTRLKARNDSSEVKALRDRLKYLEGLSNTKVRVLGTETNSDQKERLTKEIDALKSEYVQVLAQLQRGDPEYAARTTATASDLAGVQKTLEPNVTLVSFHVLKDQVVAFVIGRDRFKAVSLALKQSDLENLIADARADHSSPVPLAYVKLYDQLIRPLQADLTTPLVGIVAHGVLHDLPLAALRDQQKNQWFGEQKLLFSLPSASSYQFIQAKRKTPTAPSVMAVGINNFQQEQLPTLTFAEGEANNVVTSPYFAAGQHRLLIGSVASKAAFLENVASFNVLHLAVHAKVDRAVGRFSKVFLTGEDSLSVADIDDLDLHNASLVVLSACNTEVGDVSASEDITSLSRAFIYAGSPSVLASLIEVNDASTSLLMSLFYSGLQQGKTKAEALQAAQQLIRQNGVENPYFWAFFTLTGDPGR
jgi:tetratricopeptide (TPR) repeat protein